MKMDAIVMIVCIVFFSCCTNIVMSIDISQFYRLQTVRVNNEMPTATSRGSLVQCASQCSQFDDCWVAQWDKKDELCEMFDYRLSISLVYPIVPETSAVTVLFGSPISVAHVKKYGGEQFTFTEARDACRALGGDVSDWSHMKGGHDAGWLHVDGCSFMNTQYKYCPNQSPVDGCGNGLYLCGYGDTADVLCTLDGYEGFV